MFSIDSKKLLYISFLITLHKSSMGFKSGEYGGKNIRLKFNISQTFSTILEW